MGLLSGPDLAQVYGEETAGQSVDLGCLTPHPGPPSCPPAPLGVRDRGRGGWTGPGWQRPHGKRGAAASPEISKKDRARETLPADVGVPGHTDALLSSHVKTNLELFQ